MKTFCITAAGCLLAWAVPAAAQNLVPNGNFEAGNTGFTSDYTYSPGNGFPQSTYTVTTNPQLFNSNFVSAGECHNCKCV